MSETRKLAAILAADVAGYSRLTATDEERTVARLRALRSDLFDPAISVHHGRVVKRTGDGILIEFRSVVDAVRCSIEVQNGMVERNAGLPPDRWIELRVGIHLGDVIEETDGDLMGDGVNIAARLEGLAEPNSIYLSRSAYEQVDGKISTRFVDLGEKELKNIPKAVRVFAIVIGKSSRVPRQKYKQDIRFCRTKDGVQLAFASIGDGSVVVKTGNWLTHLEYDHDSPLWGELYQQIAVDHTLIRYDTRGNGLSDREVENVTFDALVTDLEVVVDAAGCARFALFGISQGCALAVAYAVRHPERVTKLLLFGGYAVGMASASTPADKERRAAMLTLMRLGWGQDNPSFRQMFTSRFIPDATKEQTDWFNELQRIATSPEDALRNVIATGNTDVSALLSQVTAPTLVMHSSDDAAVPFDRGRQLAAGIPGARFMPLSSRNHIIFDSEPAFPRFLQEIKSFLAD